MVRTQEDSSFDVDSALARGWSSLDNDKKDEYTRKFELMKGEKVGVIQPGHAGQSGQFDELEEDVEMGEDVAIPNDGAADGGFTAVNRG